MSRSGSGGPLREVPPSNNRRSPSTAGSQPSRRTTATATDIYGRPQARKSKTTLQAPSERVYAPRPKHHQAMVLPETPQGATPLPSSQQGDGPNFFARKPPTNASESTIPQQEASTTGVPTHPSSSPAPSVGGGQSSDSVVNQRHTGPLDGRHLELLARMREQRDFNAAKTKETTSTSTSAGRLVIPNAMTAEELKPEAHGGGGGGGGGGGPRAQSGGLGSGFGKAPSSPQQTRQSPPTLSTTTTTSGGPSGIEAFWKDIKTEDDFSTPHSIPSKTPTTAEATPKKQTSIPSATVHSKREANSQATSDEIDGGKKKERYDDGGGKSDKRSSQPSQFKPGKGHCFVSFFERCFDPLRLSSSVLSPESRRLLSTGLIPLRAAASSTHTTSKTKTSSSHVVPPTLIPWEGTIEELSQFLLSDLWRLAHDTCIYLAAFDPGNPMPWSGDDGVESKRDQKGSPGRTSPGGRNSGHTEELGGEVAPSATSFTAIAKKMGKARTGVQNQFRSNKDDDSHQLAYLTAVEWSFITQTACELRYRRASFYSITPCKRTVAAMVELAVGAGLTAEQQESLVMTACSEAEMDLAVEGMVQDVHELLLFLMWVSCKYNFSALAEHFEYQRALKEAFVSSTKSSSNDDLPTAAELAVMDKFLIPAEFASDLEFEAAAGRGYLSSMEWPPIGFPMQRRLNDRIDLLGRNLGLHQLLIDETSDSNGGDVDTEVEEIAGSASTYPTDMRSPPRLRRQLLRLVSNPDSLGYEEVSFSSTEGHGASQGSHPPPPPPLADRYNVIQRQLTLALKRLDVSWKKVISLTHRAGLQGRYTLNDIMMAGGCLNGEGKKRRKNRETLEMEDDQFETYIKLLERQLSVPERLKQVGTHRREGLQIISQRMRALEGTTTGKKKGGITKGKAPSLSILQQYEIASEEASLDGTATSKRSSSPSADPLRKFLIEVEEFWREVKASTSSSSSGGAVPGSRQAQLKKQGSSAYLEREEKRFAKENPEDADEVVHSVGHVSFYELSLQSCLSRELLRTCFDRKNPTIHSQKRAKEGQEGEEKEGKGQGEEQTAFLSDEQREVKAEMEKILDPVLYDANNILQFPGSIQDSVSRCYEAAVRAQEVVMAAEQAGDIMTEENQHPPVISEEEVKSIFLRHPGSVQACGVGSKSALPPGTTVSSDLVGKTLRVSLQAESLALMQLREEEKQELERAEKFGGGSGRLTLDHLGLREVGCARSNEGEIPSPSMPSNDVPSVATPTAGGSPQTMVGAPGSPVYI